MDYHEVAKSGVPLLTGKIADLVEECFLLAYL